MTMTLEYDEKGKFFTDIIRKDVILTEIHTRTHHIRGYVHIRVGDRLSDEINRDIFFLPVTDAEVYSLEGELLYATSFLSVNRGQIVWLMPVDEHKAQPK
jgi:hypothetical protein